MKIIAIANQKGGTAKTTTTAALGVLLSRAGVRTHLVDMDPQASLTAAFGQRDADGRLFSAFHEQAPLPVVSVCDNLTLSPSNLDLLRAETEFLTQPSREFLLRSSLEKVDFCDDTIVLVDCPPSLGILSVASLVAADGLCLVVQPGGFELQTLVHLDQTVDLLRQFVNPQLKTIGAIVTNSHRRRAITDQVARELSSQYSVLGVVRADARIVYATTAGRVDRLRRSSALDDYSVVANRLIDWSRQ